MCDVAVDDYLSTIEFFPECYKTQEISNNKAVNVFFFNLILFPIETRLKKCLMKLLMIA